MLGYAGYRRDRAEEQGTRETLEEAARDVAAVAGILEAMAASDAEPAGEELEALAHVLAMAAEAVGAEAKALE